MQFPEPSEEHLKVSSLHKFDLNRHQFYSEFHEINFTTFLRCFAKDSIVIISSHINGLQSDQLCTITKTQASSQAPVSEKV